MDADRLVDKLLAATDAPPDPAAPMNPWDALLAHSANLRAFELMLRRSEHGPGTGPNDYRRLVGGELIGDLSNHPRRTIALFFFSNGKVATDRAAYPGVTVTKSLYSSAAGAYQILTRTWDESRARYPGQLPDFTPPTQDRWCVMKLKERHALDAVLAGDLALALDRSKLEWASLAGAGYGQHENSMDSLRQWYVGYGGTIGAPA